MAARARVVARPETPGISAIVAILAVTSDVRGLTATASGAAAP